MANKVTTEWVDIHIKLGNYLPYEKEKTLYEENKEYQEKVEEQNKLENVFDSKTKEQIDEMEDDLDMDDDFCRQYMSKRMNEIKELAKRSKYGSVIEINKQDYVEKVTNADPESFVVISMYQDYNQMSLLINKFCQILAPKYPYVKFVKTVATKCVEKFPDESLPCVIIYKAGKNLSCTSRVTDKINPTLQGFEQFLYEHSVLSQPL